MQLLIVISGRMRIVEWLQYLRAFGTPKSASAASALVTTVTLHAISDFKVSCTTRNQNIPPKLGNCGECIVAA